MKTLRFVLGDQLTRSLSSLVDLDPSRDVVLMAEVHDEATYVRHHKKKIAFLFSAMRHFAEELRAEGIDVDYVKIDDPHNTGSFSGELQRAVKCHDADAIVVTEPGEWRVQADMLQWQSQTGLPVTIRADDRFMASTERFARWAEDRKTLRMEFFYREMRKETGLLMDEGEPVGGRWNFDTENRRALPKAMKLPQRLRFAPDAITKDVMHLIDKKFDNHFGDLEPFEWAVTRADSLKALDHFILHALPNFGAYQDAMMGGEPFIFHALLSPYLNCGLLTPREVCDRAEAAYHERHAPLNAVEGFIRQILGWREYIRGIYWLKMPDYARTNALDATRPMPWLYWSGETKMNCMAQAIGQTRRHAYSHHIQRLMVTGNFALLAGINPAEVNEWYLVVYTDAYEWVELPNTHGMSLFADNGLLASKPYASSGAYIDRMSDFCKSCAYDVKQKTGPDACPFNFLYWAFLIRNAKKLGRNPRMAMPYRTLAGWSQERKAQIVQEAEDFLDEIASPRPVDAGNQFNVALSATAADA